MAIERTSRTYHALKNATVTFLCRMVYIAISFVCRTIFTYMLGAEYLGVNGVFSNILYLLSFVEMGMGSALVYMMYEPWAIRDVEKINACLHLYKKAYGWVAVIVGTVGAALIPFLPYIVEAPNVKEDLSVLYCMFLMNTVVSYVCVYKKSVFIVSQENYVISLVEQLFNTIMNVVQIVILFFSHNYLAYLAVMIVCNLGSNIAISMYAQKKYPFIKSRTSVCLTEEEVSGFKKNVKGLFLNKISNASFFGSDNIFISAYDGVRQVGIYSNYTLITTVINGVMNLMFSAVTGSIGNMGVEKNPQKSRTVLNRMYFLNVVLYSFICMELVLLLQEFVSELWLTKEYYLKQSIIFLIVFELLLRGEHYVIVSFRNATGNFAQLRFLSVFGGVLNIVLDVVLGSRFGIAGVICASVIGMAFLRYTDVYVVYKYELKHPMSDYIVRHVKYMLLYIVQYFILSRLLKLIVIETPVGEFIVKALVVACFYWLSVFILLHKKEEFIYYFELIRGSVMQRYRKGKKNMS